MKLLVDINKEALIETARKAAQQLPDKQDLYLCLAEYINTIPPDEELQLNWGDSRRIQAFQNMVDGIILQGVYGTNDFKDFKRNRDITELERHIARMKQKLAKVRKEAEVEICIDELGKMDNASMIASYEKSIRKHEERLKQII